MRWSYSLERSQYGLGGGCTYAEVRESVRSGWRLLSSGVDMVVHAALALALFGLSGHADSHRHRVLKPAGWTLAVENDNFTGRVKCTLHKRDVLVNKGSVVLQLGRHVDTSAADVRIDGGPAQNVRAFPQPAYDRDLQAHDDILNESGGRVSLPLASVASAKVVYVRTDAHGRIYRFDVSGLAEAMDAWLKEGC